MLHLSWKGSIAVAQQSTQTLEVLVQHYRSLRSGFLEEGSPPGRRMQSEADREFRRIVSALSARIRYLTRRYGLDDMADDAAQACAIGIHRAIASYDPQKAAFATHATWAMRGELQSLRHRVRLDQRTSARNASIVTVALGLGHEDDAAAALEIVDETAQQMVEEGASAHLASRWARGLIGAASDEKRITHRDGDRAWRYWMEGGQGNRAARERQRQAGRRVARHCFAIHAAMAGA
ncbi:sigma factor [Erythrobacteraceae bacterium WH01K]|nr:sigma factor [Erythrobacteraceae bacterium WH01K]